MNTRERLPSRRELRAALLDAMAHQLECDDASDDDKYCIGIEDATAVERETHRERLQSVAAELSQEWRRRAVKLRLGSK